MQKTWSSSSTVPATLVDEAHRLADGSPVYPLSSNGHGVPADKHLADVREQSRKWIYDA